jgi:hypothetical protein
VRSCVDSCVAVRVHVRLLVHTYCYCTPRWQRLTSSAETSHATNCSIVARLTRYPCRVPYFGLNGMFGFSLFIFTGPSFPPVVPSGRGGGGRAKRRSNRRCRGRENELHPSISRLGRHEISESTAGWAAHVLQRRNIRAYHGMDGMSFEISESTADPAHVLARTKEKKVPRQKKTNVSDILNGCISKTPQRRRTRSKTTFFMTRPDSPVSIMRGLEEEMEAVTLQSPSSAPPRLSAAARPATPALRRNWRIRCLRLRPTPSASMAPP